MTTIQNLFQKILLWVRITRPHTLFASLSPVVVGLLVAGLSLQEQRTLLQANEALREAQLQRALAEENQDLLQGLDVLITNDTVMLLSPTATTPTFHWGIALLTLLCAMALQIFANLVNDLYDFLKGTDEKGRVGFKRALAEGTVQQPQMRIAIYITLGIILLSGLLLIHHGGFPILLIGVASILFAWLYTATRYSLSYLGIADIFVFLFFGVIATAGTTYLQTGHWESTSLLAGGVNGVISMCVLTINNLRDRESDAQAHKRTLPVRFGPQAGYIELVVCALFSGLFAWWAFGLALPCLIIIPMAGLVVEAMHAEGKAFNRCLLHAGLCNLIYVILVVIMFLLRYQA